MRNVERNKKRKMRINGSSPYLIILKLGKAFEFKNNHTEY